MSTPDNVKAFWAHKSTSKSTSKRVYLRAQRTITTRDKRGNPFPITVRAVYNGTGYIDLYFGASINPSEVINVYSRNMNDATQQDLARVLREWIDANEQDERSYMDEDTRVRYGWLKLYWDNSDQGAARWAR